MGNTAVFLEIKINADIDRVWLLTQDPALHPRWDLRFSSITPAEQLPSGGYRFVYERRLLLHTIIGTGASVGERRRPGPRGAETQ